MSQEVSELILIPIVGTVVILSLLVFLLAFFFVYQRRQMSFKQEKAELNARFSKEMLETQFEVQNATLLHIGQELHDNVGQVLAVARINLNTLEESDNINRDREYIVLANQLVFQAMQDVRELAKSFDSDAIKELGLLNSIARELGRIERSSHAQIKTHLHFSENVHPLNYERELVLFRIFQELSSNTLKHAQATEISVTLLDEDGHFQFHYTDNGTGFDLDAIETGQSKSGSGIRNIRRRTELINGALSIASALGKGTEVTISLDPL